jgi:hypothetical protein
VTIGNVAKLLAKYVERHLVVMEEYGTKSGLSARAESTKPRIEVQVLARKLERLQVANMTHGDRDGRLPAWLLAGRR